MKISVLLLNKLFLRDRLMVGHLALNQKIGVRFPVPQLLTDDTIYDIMIAYLSVGVR